MDICGREVIHALAEKERWPVGWAFDGVRNIYSPTNFLPQHEEEREVRLLHFSPMACMPAVT